MSIADARPGNTPGRAPDDAALPGAALLQQPRRFVAVLSPLLIEWLDPGAQLGDRRAGNLARSALPVAVTCGGLFPLRFTPVAQETNPRCASVSSRARPTRLSGCSLSIPRW